MASVDFSSPYPAVYVPSGATLDQFRSWIYSNVFPEKLKVSFIQGLICVEPSESHPVVEIPESGMTLDDFRNWAYSDEFPERGRITYIGGRLFIDMSPERIDAHNQVKSALNRVIDVLVHELDLGTYYPDGAWLTNAAAGVSNEPDAMFASWETLDSGRLAPRPRSGKQDDSIELTGAPDWVCEIISNSSEKVDKKDLVDSYYKAGIREYWLIDARGAEIDFQLLVWTPTGYQPVEPREGWFESPVFGREFQLARQRDRLGRWAYELRQQAV